MTSSKEKSYVEKGKLYICGTPIGNLDDITYRALRVLKEVDLIAAEDTRRTIKLLNYFEIENKLESYHEHNEEEKAKELLSLLTAGKAIALVSDAGMPGISDPGFEITRLAVKRGIELVPIPGPTAAISALVASGLDTRSFVFEGFLHRKGQDRIRALEEIGNQKRTLIIYESPYRVKKTLEDLEDYIAERRVALVRELTKLHEEKLYGSPKELLEQLDGLEVKGEVVLVIEGNKNIQMENEGWEELSILDHLKLVMDQGLSKKKAIKEVAKVRDLPKSDVYKEAIAIDISEK
ncbi:16S rRNA (cytidine(1402)-2'-O)-methyltransferase [Natronospora cellulosivora (SeqCode)]